MSTAEPPRGLAVPVLKSLLSAEGLAEVVAREYGLEEVRCELLKAVTLDTYRVRSRTGSFALRVYPARRRSEAEVRGELEFLARLDAAGVPVPVAVPRADGGLLLALEAPEGTRLAALFGFAPGQALGDRLTPESCRAYGALLARVHRAADAMPPIAGRPALTVEALVDGPLDELVRAYGARSSAAAVGRHAAAAVRPVIAALPRDPPAWGLCHGEPGTGNVLTTADGRLTLLDFDFCGPGWRAYDLAVAVNDLPGAGARDLLEGYREVRALAAEEVEAIPAFQAAHCLWVLAMRARHLNEWGAYLFPEPLVVQTFAKIEALVEGLKQPRAASGA